MSDYLEVVDDDDRARRRRRNVGSPSIRFNPFAGISPGTPWTPIAQGSGAAINIDLSSPPSPDPGNAVPRTRRPPITMPPVAPVRSRSYAPAPATAVASTQSGRWVGVSATDTSPFDFMANTFSANGGQTAVASALSTIPGARTQSSIPGQVHYMNYTSLYRSQHPNVPYYGVNSSLLSQSGVPPAPTTASSNHQSVPYTTQEENDFIKGTAANNAPIKPGKQTATVASTKNRLNFSTPQDFVTVIVDKDAALQTFVVHKSIISHYSPFFQKAFTSAFKEGLTQRMIIEDVSASTFGLFVHWLYTQALEQTCGSPLSMLQNAKLFVLAERFMVPSLPQQLLETMESSVDDFDKENTTLSEFQSYAYGTEPVEWKQNPLKKLAILQSMAEMMRNRKGIWMMNGGLTVEGMPEGMLTDLMEAMISGCGSRRDWKIATFAGVKAMTSCMMSATS